jgi:hypothetical protein
VPRALCGGERCNCISSVLDAGYQPAADALRWFRTLDRACAAHLANDEEPSSTF